MAARNFPPIKDRFLAKVERFANGCWEWRGTFFVKKNGRPAFWMKGRLRIAARAGWEIFRGPIPKGKMLCHKVECSNERCVNPDHLYPGDQTSNMADRDAAGRTSRWAHRYNFVQTPELEAKVRAMRAAGTKIEDICKRLDIGRTTYYRIARRGVIDAQVTREAARKNYRRAALRRS